MNRKKFILIGVTATIGIMLNGCFRPSPGTVFKNYMKSLEKGKIDEAMKFYPDSFSQTFGQDKVRVVTVQSSQEIQAKGGIKSLKINQEDVQGDLATVKFTIVFGNGSTEADEIQLLKHDGQWYASSDTGK